MTQDERFDRIDATLERIGRRFDQVDVYISDFRSETIQRLVRLDHRLEAMGATVTNVDARLPVLTKTVLDADVFTAQLAERVRKLEERVAKLEPAA